MPAGPERTAQRRQRGVRLSERLDRITQQRHALTRKATKPGKQNVREEEYERTGEPRKAKELCR